MASKYRGFSRRRDSCMPRVALLETHLAACLGCQSHVNRLKTWPRMFFSCFPSIFLEIFLLCSSFFSLLLLLIVPFSIFEGISLFEFTPPLPLTLLLGSSFLLSFLLLLLLLLRHASKKMKHPERYRFNIHPSLVPHLIFFDFPSVFWGLRACVRPSVSNAPEMIIPLVLSVMDAQLGFCPIRRLQDSLCGVHHSIRIEGCGGLYLLFIHFFFLVLFMGILGILGIFGCFCFSVGAFFLCCVLLFLLVSLFLYIYFFFFFPIFSHFLLLLTPPPLDLWRKVASVRYKFDSAQFDVKSIKSGRSGGCSDGFPPLFVRQSATISSETDDMAARIDLKLLLLLLSIWICMQMDGHWSTAVTVGGRSSERVSEARESVHFLIPPVNRIQNDV